MAVDTAGKRYSMMGWGAPAPPSPLPVPDGEIASADKLHLLGLYSGIAVTPTGVILSAIVWLRQTASAIVEV